MRYSRVLENARFALAIGFGLAVTPFAGAQGDLGRIGDVLEIGLPLASLGTAFWKNDREGERQWLFSTGSTVVVTQSAKWIFADTDWGRRPNGGDKAFPSGHAALACSGSAFLTNRYGWRYGLPAYALAGLAAYSRIDEREHRWRDVLAGCGVAIVSAEYWVTRSPSINIVPQIDRKSVDVALSGRF